MKGKVKKNQLIIVALAVMIAAAGYLNYTGRLFGENAKGTKEANADLTNQELLDISQEDTEAGSEEIYGYYYPTAKNNMVRKFYGELGFEKCSEDEAGNSVWKLNTAGYEKRNHVIEVES
mgnify:CR=1 FL=1